MSVINYFIKNIDKIVGFTINHFILVIMAILLALTIWISVGILIRNNEKLANGMLGLGSLIMSIPSVALYGILVTIPGFGLSRKSAVFGLILYSMLPIMRNVYVALNKVDEDILESARGMGMTSKQILFKVQLPLAFPVIFAGVRMAIVMMVGIATLAVYIGERNLGSLIEQGIRRTHFDMIVVGAVLVSLMAILIDIFMGKLETKLISPGLISEEQNFKEVD
ncbi:ABC transporter permease [Schnuerera sp.]|uniref:ABC transporter permease n=1 Tax=Schnuerera sp. TaxID=2794844 RepID=UPI002CD36064|nr:ABC transporter permease [Schnuerera sp.]HSH35374.1 ABC transporter permease [Schnuerera sp.]